MGGQRGVTHYQDNIPGRDKGVGDKRNQQKGKELLLLFFCCGGGGIIMYL